MKNLKTITFGELEIGDKFANFANNQINVFIKTNKGIFHRKPNPDHRDFPEPNAIFDGDNNGVNGFAFNDDTVIYVVAK